MTCFLIQLIPVLIFASPAPVPGRLFCEFGLLTFLQITRQNRSLVGAFARIVAIHSRSSPPRTNAINFPCNSLSRASSFTFSTYKLNSPHSAISANDAVIGSGSRGTFDPRRGRRRGGESLSDSCESAVACLALVGTLANYQRATCIQREPHISRKG